MDKKYSRLSAPPIIQHDNKENMCQNFINTVLNGSTKCRQSEGTVFRKGCAPQKQDSIPAMPTITEQDETKKRVSVGSNADSTGAESDHRGHRVSKKMKILSFTLIIAAILVFALSFNSVSHNQEKVEIQPLKAIQDNN